jgi:prepilin-type N-terminal cleavage/methylation domain-containing protein
MKMSMKKNQAGFTLVEIAIVLVIIGLLLGGVLKGTELIENSKVKRAANEVNGITAAFYSYQDRYQRLPGDDGPLATLTARGGSWASVTAASTGPNGVIASTAAQTFTAPNGEPSGFWQHLKAAGFINGQVNLTGAAVLPPNAFGGLIGFTSGSVGNPAAPIQGRVVCLSQVPGKSAAALDVQLDDGLGNTGRMRGTLGAAGANTAPTAAVFTDPYNETSVYTICVQM